MAGVGLQVRITGTGVRLMRRLEQAKGLVNQAILMSLKEAVAWVTRDAKLGAPIRSGRLRASIRGRVEMGLAGGGLGIVGSNVIYARIQELGGTVKARNVQFLTIPVGAAKTPAGVTRREARSFPNTFVIQGRSGSLVIMQRHGRGARPLFVLKRSVRLEPRPYLAPALERNRPAIRQRFGREVKTALEAG